MADDEARLVSPVDPDHEDCFDVLVSANCMKHPVYIYYLDRPVDPGIEDAMAPLGAVQFPLGRQCGVVKMDIPERFQLSGILGLKELRITLRLNALADSRARFESLLWGYCQKAARPNRA